MSRPFQQVFDASPVISKNKGMNKILLIYDDYTELTTVEFSLKKVGFDVVAISSEFSTQEKLLSFNPEIVIAYGRGPKMTTIGVGRRLKEMGRWGGKAILIFPPGNKPDPQDLIRTRMDLLLEAPVPTVRLIQILAKMTNQDDQVLVEKLIKAAATEATNPSQSAAPGAGAKQDDKVIVTGQSQGADGEYAIGGGKTDKKNLSSTSFEMNLAEENIEKVREKVSGPSSVDPQAIAAKTKKNQFVLNPEGEKTSSSEDTAFDMAHPFLSETEKFPTAPQRQDQDPFLQMKKELDGPKEPLPSPGYKQIQNEIDQERAHLAERTKKYFEFTHGLKLQQESTLNRSKVRIEQKKLTLEWSATELQEQDQLRRKFTKALFKK